MTAEWAKGEGPLEWVDEAELRVGDVVMWLGEKRRIATMRPYGGGTGVQHFCTFHGGGGFIALPGQPVQRVPGEVPPGLGLVWLMPLEGEYDSTCARMHAVPAVEAAWWCELAELCEDVDVLAVTPPGLADASLGLPAWVFSGPRSLRLRVRQHHTRDFVGWVISMYEDDLALAGKTADYNARAAKRAQMNLDCARTYFARLPGSTL